MVQSNKEENNNNNTAATVAHPYVIQIIQTQAKAINQFSNLNQALVERTIAFIDRFLNYDMQKIKQYDEFNRFLMEQKNIEKGIHNPHSQQQPIVEQSNNNNPILDILNKLNFLKAQPEGSNNYVNPAVPPAHVPSSANNNNEVHPDFVPNNNAVDLQLKKMHEMIDKLERIGGVVQKENDNE